MAPSVWGKNTRLELIQNRDENPVLLLPTGATEQHGNHLPVNTDTAIVSAVAHAAAEATPKTMVLPSLPFGYSPHHEGIPGTITLSSETLEGIVRDVLASLTDSGFTNIIIVNGHGGNRSVLKTAVSDFRSEEGTSVAVVSYWDLIQEEAEKLRDSTAGGMSHGGELETSIQLFLDESVVNGDQNDFVRDDRKGYIRTDLFSTGTVYYPFHFDEVTEDGASGSPSKASAEKGKRLFDAVVEELSTFIEHYRRWEHKTNGPTDN